MTLPSKLKAVLPRAGRDTIPPGAGNSVPTMIHHPASGNPTGKADMNGAFSSMPGLKTDTCIGLNVTM
jgi:hypothetical protein